ncbi:MAG: 4-hydroxythreonine-4-phosphate dehydrogenase PdxA [Thermodesulfobacteriota bacterium]
MKQKERPLLGITIGDPGSIGPEVCTKALSNEYIYEICRPLLIGDTRVVAEAIDFCNLELTVNSCSAPDEGAYCHGGVDVLNLNNMPLNLLNYKMVTAKQGQASFDYVAKAIELAKAGDIDGTVTGPISKEAINEAGHHYAGHTEIYAELTNTADYAMMLVDNAFRVVHVSTHVSLRKACDRVKKERIITAIDLTHAALQQMGIASPSIGVACLNPHCGEGRLFGDEEEKEIIPAVIDAQGRGILVEGPLPADTVFVKMKGGMFDAVVVMYHDQGHIPAKLVGFHYDDKSKIWDKMSGINVTLGLPIIRASVDHGTAFDKAGDNSANPKSMLDAIELASVLSVS